MDVESITIMRLDMRLDVRQSCALKLGGEGEGWKCMRHFRIQLQGRVDGS